MAEDVWTAEADKGQLEQVVLELLANARDAIAPGHGTVTLSVDNVPLAE